MIFMPAGLANALRSTRRPTKFSLAANHDPEPIPALAAYPVDEVYGKFPRAGVGGGCPRFMATPLSEADLRSRFSAVMRIGRQNS